MKNNKDFKKLQCDLSPKVFAKLKKDAKECKLSIGKYLEKILEALDKSHIGLTTSDEDDLLIGNEAANIAQKNYADNYSTLIIGRKVSSPIPKPWYKRIFN